MTAAETLSAPANVRQGTVEGAGGCALHVRDCGPEDAAPLVLLHGLLLSGAAWQRQIDALSKTHRVVAVDLRGHGLSGRPTDDGYGDPDVWATDVHAVLQQLALDNPVLVAASYSGMVVADYLRRFSDDGVAGLFLVAPLRKIGTAEALALLGDEFLGLVGGLLATDVDEALDATTRYLRLARHDPWPEEEAYERLGSALTVPPAARGAMLAREQDNDDVWKAVETPTMVAYGSQDAIIHPASSERLATLVPGAQARLYQGTGHMPFAEQPEAFNADLRAFVSACNDR